MNPPLLLVYRLSGCENPAVQEVIARVEDGVAPGPEAYIGRIRATGRAWLGLNYEHRPVARARPTERSAVLAVVSWYAGKHPEWPSGVGSARRIAAALAVVSERRWTEEVQWAGYAVDGGFDHRATSRRVAHRVLCAELGLLVKEEK